jgi:Domain of unknown function (DUF4190)
MTQYTPPVQIDYGHGAAPRRTSGAAIASLVLGIVGCVPFITGILAIVLGVIGIRKTREPTVGGKGLAIAGLVLGIISVVVWSVCGAALGIGYVESRPAGVVAKQFLHDVAAGNTNGAMANSVNFTAAQIQSQTASMSTYGALQSIRITSFYFTSSNGQTVMLLSGSALYSNGPRTCSFRLVKQGGVYKVAGYKVY